LVAASWSDEPDEDGRFEFKGFVKYTGEVS